MRKDQIRKLTAEHLAMLGYSEGHYFWPKRGKLRVCVEFDAIPAVGVAGEKADGGAPLGCMEFRLVAGMSRKATLAVLGQIPRKGTPRAVARQFDLSDPQQPIMGTA